MIDRQQKERGFLLRKKQVAGRGHGDLTQLDQLQQSGQAERLAGGRTEMHLPSTILQAVKNQRYREVVQGQCNIVIRKTLPITPSVT